MTEQQTMPPLVVDFEGIEDPEVPGNHFWFYFDNGYSASVLRHRDEEQDHQTLGYDEGRWEAITLYRDEFARMMGLTQGIPVFDTGLTPDLEGAVAGNLDNAGVAEFLAKVSALPTRTGPAYKLAVETDENAESEETESE